MVQNHGVPPVIIHLNGIFHEINHPSILGYPDLWKPPDGFIGASPVIATFTRESDENTLKLGDTPVMVFF